MNSNLLFQVGKATGKLRRFIIEPFIAHKDVSIHRDKATCSIRPEILMRIYMYLIKQEEEAYVCIYSERNGDVILFHHQGGVDIGEVDETALRLTVEIDSKPNRDQILSGLLVNVADAAKKEYVQFAQILNCQVFFCSSFKRKVFIGKFLI